MHSIFFLFTLAISGLDKDLNHILKVENAQLAFSWAKSLSFSASKMMTKRRAEITS